MKILIVKASALGDIIHAFPVVDYIRAIYPNATIHWAVERSFSALVKAHPEIQKAVLIDTKKWRKGVFSSTIRKEIYQFIRELRQESYDVIFDLQGNTKSGLITGLAKGKKKVGFAWKTVSEWPNLLFTNQKMVIRQEGSARQDYLEIVQSYFSQPCSPATTHISLKLTPEEEQQFTAIKKTLPLQPTVMVCHGSNWKNKQLTQEALVDFLKLLQGHLNCHYVFAWGTSQEHQEASELQQHFADSTVLDKVSLPVLQHLMNKMQLVVAMDSLPLHLAATTQTPTFSIFGASLAARYAPTGPQHLTYQGTCPYGRTFSTRCPTLRSCKTGACIRSLSGQTIFESYLQNQQDQIK
ncbi:MAG: lipopolysaccharide heptosyltransferase I [Parachlamydiaceae bacterium]